MHKLFFIMLFLFTHFFAFPQLSAKFKCSDTVICKGACINFTDMSTGSPASWDWTFNGANPSVSSAQNPSTICFPNAGTYSVRLIISDGFAFDSAFKTITVNSPSLSISPDVTIAPGASTTLNVSGVSVVSCTWTPVNDLSGINIFNPVANPGSTTTYSVTGTDLKGCTETVAVTVFVIVPEVPCHDLFLPNAFSPNGDGENELICVMGNCIESLQFLVYDRWGEKVFETKDPSRCWDGQYKGKVMETGIFVYYLNATLKSGEKITKKGNINLLR